jgi:hypothetical protein
MYTATVKISARELYQKQQDSQCMRNVTLRNVRGSLLWRKSYKYYIFDRVCVRER